jgi:hypothetical protein
MIGTPREALERAHNAYRAQKAAVVRAAHAPHDVEGMLEVWRGYDMHLEPMALADGVRPYCEGLVGTGVDCLVFSNDAFRQPFSEVPRAVEATTVPEEVLCSVLVSLEGDLGAVISPYRYLSPTVLEFLPAEWDSLLDQSVVEDLRQAYR